MYNGMVTKPNDHQAKTSRPNSQSFGLLRFVGRLGNNKRVGTHNTAWTICDNNKVATMTGAKNITAGMMMKSFHAC